jgi:hypothetical protein
MAKADSLPCWCKCSICLIGTPQGVIQSLRTSRKHHEDDDRRLGLSRGTSWVQHSDPRSASSRCNNEWFCGLEGTVEPYFNDAELSDGTIDGEEMDIWRDNGVESTHHLEGDFEWLAEDGGMDSCMSGFSSDAEEGEDPNVIDSLSDCESDTSDLTPNCNTDPIENIIDVINDPLFHSRQSLFNRDQPEEDSSEGVVDRDLPWALDDHPAVRNAYLRVFLGVSFDGMTHKAASLMLNGFLVAFRAVAAAGTELLGIENFARTIATVEKRLGVSTEGFIIYLFLCPNCWQAHHPRELLALKSPTCSKPDCLGILYTTKRLADNTEKRTPSLILPFVPPSKAIRRMCMRPGKVEQWQHWRKPGDEPGVRPPTTAHGFDAYPDPDKLLTDVTDAWGWRAIQAGLERRRNGVWDVRDINVLEKAQQFVALPNGLVFQMNIDW